MMTEKRNTENRALLQPCADYADRLVDLSDGDLPEADRSTVESHVQACAGCAAELQRLDASLLQLRGDIFAHVRGLPTQVAQLVADLVERPPQRALSRRRNARVLAVGVAAAVLVVAFFVGREIMRSFDPARPGQTAQATSQGSEVPATVTDPGTSGGAKTPMDQEDVLRRITLIEQQARLQASLDLLPNDPYFADQRAANERLIARFQEAVVGAQ